MGYEVIPPSEAIPNTNEKYGVDFKFNSAGVFTSMQTRTKQVRANLKNLLLTQVGERYYLPEFGCRLLSALFEPNTDDIKPFIQDTIFQAVQKWMPYLNINVDIITAEDDPSLTDSIKVTVTGFFDGISLTPIAIFASESGVSVSDSTTN